MCSSLQLEDVLQERKKELKLSHQKELEALRQEHERALGKIKDEQDEKVGWQHHWTLMWYCNSLAPGRCDNDFHSVIFKLILDIHILSTYCDFRWMPQSTLDDNSTLVKVMAWCCQVTSHFLNQWWPKYMLLCGITRPHWIKRGGQWEKNTWICKSYAMWVTEF